MDLLDRLITLAIGGFIGYVLARIVDYLRCIKEEVDEIYEIETRRGERGVSRLKPIILDSILIGVVILVAYAAWSSNRANHAVENEAEEDRQAICDSLAEARETDRDLVDAVYQLALGAIDRPKGAPPLTAEQLDQVNSYIDRVNDFRRVQYAKIQPSEVCKPLVDPEPKLPPTPDKPNLTQ